MATVVNKMAPSHWLPKKGLGPFLCPKDSLKGSPTGGSFFGAQKKACKRTDEKDADEGRTPKRHKTDYRALALPKSSLQQRCDPEEVAESLEFDILDI